jgi:hypothetical protein
MLLMVVLLAIGVRPAVAAAGAAVIACSPLSLFSHSELLREPFILPLVLLFVLGILLVLHTRRPFRYLERLGGAILAAGGFLGATMLRPYLLLLLLLVLVVALVLVLLSAIIRGRACPFGAPHVAVVAALLIALGAYGVPRSRGVHRYSDRSVFDTSSGTTVGTLAIVKTADGRMQLVDTAAWREAIAAKKAADLTRSDLLVPHWCTVEWRTSSAIPSSIDAKLQSLACARENYLRFCDASLFGSRADRFCDESTFASPAGAVAHVPRAAAFALLVPFPRMWFDGFGANGTGLRRIGYVVDGVLHYLLLVGLLVFGWRFRSHAPEGLVLCVALVAVLTLYGMAVPTQFILARLRLAIFTPLLALGAAGWLLWLHERSQRTAAA